jgi:hypothetical protein
VVRTFDILSSLKDRRLLIQRYEGKNKIPWQNSISYGDFRKKWKNYKKIAILPIIPDNFIEI